MSQVSTRLAVLQRLWNLIALLQSPTDRMTAFAHVWVAAIDLHLQSKQAASQGGYAEMAKLLGSKGWRGALDFLLVLNHLPSFGSDGNECA